MMFNTVLNYASELLLGEGISQSNDEKKSPEEHLEEAETLVMVRKRKLEREMNNYSRLASAEYQKLLAMKKNPNADPVIIQHTAEQVGTLRSQYATAIINLRFIVKTSNNIKSDATTQISNTALLKILDSRVAAQKARGSPIKLMKVAQKNARELEINKDIYSHISETIKDNMDEQMGDENFAAEGLGFAIDAASILSEADLEVDLHSRLPKTPKVALTQACI